MRRRQAKIAERQMVAIEQKLTDKKVKKGADKILKAMERRELRAAALALAEQKREDMIAASDHNHMVGTQELWDSIGPAALQRAQQREAKVAQAIQEKREAERQQSADQAKGLAMMNPGAKAKGAKAPAQAAKPKAKRKGGARK